MLAQNPWVRLCRTLGVPCDQLTILNGVCRVELAVSGSVSSSSSFGGEVVVVVDFAKFFLGSRELESCVENHTCTDHGSGKRVSLSNVGWLGFQSIQVWPNYRG